MISEVILMFASMIITTIIMVLFPIALTYLNVFPFLAYAIGMLISGIIYAKFIKSEPIVLLFSFIISNLIIFVIILFWIDQSLRKW